MTETGSERDRDISPSKVQVYHGTTLYTSSWAVVVGVNHYEEQRIPDLQYAERDAQAVANMLPLLGFPADNIRLLLASREPVTRDRIFGLIEEELHPRMDEDDRLLLYFAGHGVTVEVGGERRGYLLLPTSKMHGPWPNEDRPFLSRPPVPALDMATLLHTMEGLVSKHKLALLDACCSGFITRSREMPKEVRPKDPRLAMWTKARVTQVLTAGRAGQRAVEKDSYGHGVFTYHLLQGLAGHADPRGDGLITFTELASFVRSRVVAEDVEQDPQPGKRGEGEFIFVRNFAKTELAPIAKPGPRVQADSATILVCQSGGGRYRSINEAIRNASNGDKIVVRPGVYKEGVVLDRFVEISGLGPVDLVVVEGGSEPCLRMNTPSASVRGLTLRRCWGGSGAVEIGQGHLLLDECEIRANYVACIAIFSGAASPWIRRCKLFASRLGIHAFDAGQGIFEDCEISGNLEAGVLVTKSANPVLRRCRIRSGSSFGVSVSEYGMGTFESCEISANAGAGVLIGRDGNPTMRECWIGRGQAVGIRIQDGGRGLLEDCSIFNNRHAGVVIWEGSHPVLRRCQIHDGSQSGVWIYKSEGTLEDCRIFANAFSGVVISEGGNPALVRCVIKDNQRQALWVAPGGLGTIEDCDLSDSIGEEVGGRALSALG